MNKYYITILTLLLCPILLMAANETDHFTRGIYFRSDIVAGSQFDSLMVLAKKADINSVVFDIKDMKGRIYIDIEGCPTLISRKGDLKIDLDYTVDDIHSHKMKAIARIVVFHNKRAAQAFPQYTARDSTGEQWIESKRKGAQWMDPSDPVVQNDIFTLIDTVINSGVDEIQFDYIRFPTQGNVSQARFDFMVEDEKKALNDSLYVRREKVDIIEEFLTKVKKKFNKSQVEFTADIFAIVSWQNKLDINATGQDLKKMSPHLSALHPMIYSSHFADNFGFRDNVHNEPYNIIFQGIKRSKAKTAKNCKIIPYIQANPWQVNYKKEYIAAQIAACENAGANGFILWNATINYQTTLGWMSQLNE